MRKELSITALVMFMLGFFIIVTNVPSASIVTFGMVMIAASIILLAIIFNFFQEKKPVTKRKKARKKKK